MTKNNHEYIGSLKLHAILTNLLSGIETPKIRDQNHEKNAERLIEQIEIQNYPYPLLHCQHLEEKGIGEDCVECQLLQYETYKSRFLLLAKEKGYEHTYTLKAAFDYYGTLITQYRLTECDELLDKIYSFCYSRGSYSDYYIMAIQARAFLRFKQGNYQESLDYFNMQIDILGPNEKIYENMALAYFKLGNDKEASIYYARAILLIRQKPLEQQEFSTLLIGLSGVLESTDDSLTVLDESMRLLQKRFDKPHSLMAKTLTAMGDLHIKQNDISAAETCFNKAVSIFIDTCGYETPLTANAMNKHANTLLLLDKKNEAISTFTDALSIWAKVDNGSFDPNRVAEALMGLMTESHANTQIPDKIIDILSLLQEKIEHNPAFMSDLNILCLLKFIYTIYLIKGDISRAQACCLFFKESLSQLDEKNLLELSHYRTKILQETIEILKMMEKM